MPPLPRLSAIAIVLGLLAALLAAPASAAEAEGGTVSGQLTDPNGAPLVGDEHYTVALLSETSSQRFAAQSDAEGGYVFDDVEPGTYWLRFRYHGPNDYLNMYWGGDYYFRTGSLESITVEPGGQYQVDEQLTQGVWIRGHVSGSSGPVDAPEVRIYRAWEEYPVPANTMPAPQTDANGDYRIGPLAPGEYTLSFRGESRTWIGEYHTGQSIYDDAPVTPLRVELGQDRQIDAELERTGTLHATVRVDEGDGFTTTYDGALRRYALTDLPSPAVELPTLGDGQFELGVLPHERFRIAIPEDQDDLIVESFWRDAAEYDDAEVVSVEQGSRVDIEMTAVRGGKISGRVEFATSTGSAPIPANRDVSLYLYRHTTDGLLTPISTRAGRFPFRVGTDGSFTSPVVPPGTYTAFIAADDDWYGTEFYRDARYFGERTDIEIGAGDALDLGILQLEPRYFDVGRLAGKNRFTTAVQVSQALYSDEDRPEVVYLGNAYDFPDALAAGPAAILEGGVVLTTGRDSLPSPVAEELARLRPHRIVVVGGPAAVSEAVFDGLTAFVDDPTDLTRIGGSNRYATANGIVRAAFDEGAPTVFLATGTNFPDALAAGAAAGYEGAPVLLVRGGASDLPAATADLLRDLGATKVLIVGGTAAVSEGIERSLGNMLGANRVHRLEGANRYETANNVNDAIFTDTELAFLASGRGFADALAGAPLAGALGAPLYLSKSGCLPARTAQDIWDLGTVGVWLVGGPTVLSPAVAELTVCG